MQSIDFNGRCIQVVTDEAGKQWVSVRHVCEALGISNQMQQQKLKRSPEFSCNVIITTGPDGKSYNMFCIAAEHAHLWIAGISSAKIRPEVREQFIAYKHECANIIYNHFMRKGEDFLGIAQQLKEFREETNQRLGRVEDSCAGLRREVDDLRGICDVFTNTSNQDQIRREIEETKQVLGVDGRQITGYLRKHANTSRLYRTDCAERIAAACRGLREGDMILPQRKASKVI